MIRKVGKKKYGMAANHNNSDIDHNLRFIFDCQMGGKQTVVRNAVGKRNAEAVQRRKGIP